MANLPAAIRLADRAYLYDNSEEDADARLCLQTQDAAVRKIYGPLPGWVDVATSGLPKHPDLVDSRR